MRAIPAGSYRTMPWRNGGGSTTEIAVAPEGASLEDFEWRLSMARVAADGPFSAFAGIDRTLTLLDGERMELTVDGHSPAVLTPGAPTLAFSGEARVQAAIPAGPITDFNVMTRRSRCRHRFSRLTCHGDGEFTGCGSPTVLFLAEGAGLEVRDGAGASTTLQRRDSLIQAAPAALRLRCAGPVVIFAIDILPSAG